MTLSNKERKVAIEWLFENHPDRFDSLIRAWGQGLIFNNELHQKLNALVDDAYDSFLDEAAGDDGADDYDRRQAV